MHRGEYESSSDYDDELLLTKKESLEDQRKTHLHKRLKAINPVLTAKTVIPLLVAIAIVFVPLGAAMWYASHKIEDITIDYSHAKILALITGQKFLIISLLITLEILIQTLS